MFCNKFDEHLFFPMACLQPYCYCEHVLSYVLSIFSHYCRNKYVENLLLHMLCSQPCWCFGYSSSRVFSKFSCYCIKYVDNYLFMRLCLRLLTFSWRFHVPTFWGRSNALLAHWPCICITFYIYLCCPNGVMKKSGHVMDDMLLYHAHTWFAWSLFRIGTNVYLSTYMENELTKRV